MDVRRLLEQQSTTYSLKPALIFNDQPVTYPELRENSLRLARALAGLGLSKGDRLAIYLPNGPEYVYSYLAGFCLGAVGVPLDFMLKEDELVSCLTHSEARVLIAQPRPELDLARLAAQVPGLRAMVVVAGDPAAEYGPGAVGYPELLARTAATGLPDVAVADTDPALIMYTSGTTGRPKGILLTYRHLDGSPQAMHHFVDLSDADTKLCPLPLSHVGGFIYIQNCLIFGITLVLMGRFNPYEFLKLIERHRVTCFHLVPAMYTAILSLKQIDRFDLSSLRWVVVFGAPSTPETLERFRRYCPRAQLLNGWGMTETCPPNTATPLGSANIAAVGKPAPNCEIRVVDDQDQPLPAGGVGEVVIRGWVVMAEYYKDPEATAAVKRNGWLYTGDLGRFDDEGFLYIVGRKKEMIKVGGQIVYAPEVESAFYKHEQVVEAAVIGVPDALRGEVVRAFIVLRPDSVLRAEDLRYFAREHLAHFKVPHSIVIQEALPKNRTGKVDKEALRQVPTAQG